MHILHLDSSIQGDNSASRALSAAVAERLRSLHGDAAVVYRDLAAQPLPHLTLAGFGTDEAAEALDRFMAADVVVIGAPMYNFGLSTQLKGWFDHILISGKTFRYGENGAEGLAGAKRVIVALSRGGIYGEGPAATMEHAETHLRAMLAFIGIADPQVIVAEGIAMGPEQREQAIHAALEQVAAIGR